MYLCIHSFLHFSIYVKDGAVLDEIVVEYMSNNIQDISSPVYAATSKSDSHKGGKLKGVLDFAEGEGIYRVTVGAVAGAHI